MPSVTYRITMRPLVDGHERTQERVIGKAPCAFPVSRQTTWIGCGAYLFFTYTGTLSAYSPPFGKSICTQYV